MELAEEKREIYPELIMMDLKVNLKYNIIKIKFFY